MSITNQAFIDAYRPKTAMADRPSAEGLQTLNSHEFVLSSTSSAPMVEGANPAAEISTSKKPAPEFRRPLSQVRAEELFGLRADPPHPTRSNEPRWPVACQQLLARSADQFDAVLRKLPHAAAGTLVGLVGAQQGTGCSTAAICLALRSSALGNTTLLVDANLADGGLANSLEVRHFRSWTEVLATGESIESAVMRSDQSGIDLLLSSGMDETQLESGARFRASLAAGALRRKYDRVIIDFGVPGASSSDLAAALGVDFLLATASPATTEEHLSSTAQTLSQYGLALAGVIEAAQL